MANSLPTSDSDLIKQLYEIGLHQLTERAACYGLAVRNVPLNGDCLFSAIVAQMIEKIHENPICSSKILRNCLACFMSANCGRWTSPSGLLDVRDFFSGPPCLTVSASQSEDPRDVFNRDQERWSEGDIQDYDSALTQEDKLEVEFARFLRRLREGAWGCEVVVSGLAALMNATIYVHKTEINDPVVYKGGVQKTYNIGLIGQYHYVALADQNYVENYSQRVGAQAESRHTCIPLEKPSCGTKMNSKEQKTNLEEIYQPPWADRKELTKTEHRVYAQLPREIESRRQKLVNVCDQLLPQHKFCGQSDHKCSLEEIFRVLDSAVHVQPDCPVKLRVVSGTENLIRRIAQSMMEKEPSLKIYVELKGSMKNDVKIGRADEIDFLLHLENFVFREDDGWELVRDRSDLFGAANRPHALGLDSCFQVKRTVDKDVRQDSVDEKLFDTKTDAKEGTTIYLSAGKMKSGFKQSLIEAVKALQSETPSSEMQYDFLLYMYNKLFFCLCDLSINAKVDVTPAVKFVSRTGGTVSLVPRKSHNTWQRSNDDPIELTNNDLVRQAIRIIKALLVIAKPYQQVHSDYPVRELYCFMTAKDDNYACQETMSSVLTRYFAQSGDTTGFTVPSYAILGSVMKVCRTEDMKSLRVCTLVLKALKDFQYVDPYGENLVRTRLSMLNLYSDLSNVLNILQKLKSPEDEALTTKKPDCLKSSPPCFATYLEEQYEYDPVFVFSHPELRHLSSPGDTADSMNSSSNKESPKHVVCSPQDLKGTWKVYKVTFGTLFCWFIDHCPRLMYDIICGVGTARGATYFGRLLRQFEPTDQEEPELYIGVLHLPGIPTWDAIFVTTFLNRHFQSCENLLTEVSKKVLESQQDTLVIPVI